MFSPTRKLQKIQKMKKVKVRQYNCTYLKFGFTTAPRNATRPMCLVCGSIFSNEAMKPSRLEDHLNRMHPNKIGSDFKKLRDEKSNQASIRSLFRQTDICDKQQENGLIASYNIFKLIAKTAKAHTIGEDLVLPTAKEIIETVLQQSAFSVLRVVPLSNDSVQRRIDEMSSDVLKQLVDILSETKHSLQIDEFTLSNNESLLLGYVRFIHNMQAQEEMLFAISLPADTRATTVFNAVERFCEEKEISMQNILQCATDGAAAMVGKHRGFIALMKEKIRGLIATHCVIYRQHLVARNISAELHHSLRIVIKCIDKIKARPLNDILFRTLCRDNKEDFERFLLHTEVRWLSKSARMSRFYSLYDSVIELLSFIEC